MKNNKLTKIILLVFAILVAVLAAVHLSTRTAVSKGQLRVEYNGNVSELSLEQLDWAPVQGSVLDGKGDTHPVDALGTPLSAVLSAAGVEQYSQVAVMAEDEYGAEVTAEEIAETGRVYLLRQEDGGAQLLVFGDSNSKRNVRNTVRLVVS